MRVLKAPIVPERIRRITGSFSWIDHRILTNGYLKSMCQEEILLYFFLVLVGDKNGISFYSYETICGLLKLDVSLYIHARDQLIIKSLIACSDGRFQVLSLPCEKPKQVVIQQRSDIKEFQHISELFK